MERAGPQILPLVFVSLATHLRATPSDPETKDLMKKYLKMKTIFKSSLDNFIFPFEQTKLHRKLHENKIASLRRNLL